LGEDESERQVKHWSVSTERMVVSKRVFLKLKLEQLPMGLTSRTLWTLRRYWADRLGVPSGAFEESAVTVGLAEESGVQLFCRNDALVVGAPNALVESAKARGGGP